MPLEQKPCSVDDCTRKHCARGLCRNHYQAWWLSTKPEGYAAEHRISSKECTVEGCAKGLLARGLCQMHYHRLWATGDIGSAGPIKRQPVKCHIDGCERIRRGRGLCDLHYRRFRKHGDPLKTTTPKGSRVTPDGYVYIYRNGKEVREHRWIMEQMLGRPLRDFENVHHRNGIRTDNRPENLELWVVSQPSGQRPEDLADWVIDNYPEIIEDRIRHKELNAKT